MLDLDPIKARLAAATPGPWYPWDDEVCEFSTGRKVAETYMRREPNAAFIAAAPTDVAALVAEVERLRAAIQAVKNAATFDEHGLRSMERGFPEAVAALAKVVK